MFQFSRSRAARFFSGKDRKSRLGLVAAMVMAGGLIAIPGFSAASATEGNTAAKCATFGPSFADRATAFRSFHAYVNNKEISLNKMIVTGSIKQGDTVKIAFQLKPECAGTYVGLSAFKGLTGNDEGAAQLSKQKLADRSDGTFKSDKIYTLSVKVPECFFQVDANTGGTYKPGDYTLDRQGRLIFAAQGGTTAKCPTAKPTTTTAKPTTTTAKPTTTTAKPTTTTTAKPTPTTVAGMPFTASIDATCIEGVGATANATITNSGTISKKAEVVTTSDTGKVATTTKEVPAGKTVKFDDKSVSKGLDASSNSSKVKFEVKVDGKVIATATASARCEAVHATETKPAPTTTSTTSTTVKPKPAPVKVEKAEGSATVTTACDTAAGSGAVIVIENSGNTDDTYHISLRGDSGMKEVPNSPVTVEAGKSVRKLLSMNEGQTATINVKNESGTVDVTKTVTVKCQPDVVKVVEKQAAPAQPELAKTGADLGPLALLGTSTLGLGLVLLYTARSVRRAY